jgi:hypothetical protein
MTYEEELEFFDTKLKHMANTFAMKRNDYGTTTTETFEKFGPISMLVRMHDKLGRLDNLLGNSSKDRLVATESIEDTLLDLANYALITILEIYKHDGMLVKTANPIRR